MCVFAKVGQPMAGESHPGVLSHHRPPSRQRAAERKPGVEGGK